MPRRFYLKSLPRKSSPSSQHKVSYPFWVIPSLIGTGAVLAIGLFWLIGFDSEPRSPEQKRAQIETAVPSEQDSTTGATVPKTALEKAESSAAPTASVVSLSGLRIQVLNGCGVKGLARRISPTLRSWGLDVRETKNASRPDYDHSEIIDRRGQLDAARALADSLGIKRQYVTSEFAPNLVDIDLTLIVGSDYRRLHLNTQAAKQE